MVQRLARLLGTEIQTTCYFSIRIKIDFILDDHKIARYFDTHRQTYNLFALYKDYNNFILDARKIAWVGQTVQMYPPTAQICSGNLMYSL